MTEAKMSIIGLLTNILMLIIKSCWTLCTSVVRRVMREDVLNLSISEKENSWTLTYRSCRRLVAKPAPASEPNLDPRTPKRREHKAERTRKNDMVRMYAMSISATPLSMIWAMIAGISTSINTSRIIKIGVMAVLNLYCLTRENNSLIKISPAISLNDI